MGKIVQKYFLLELSLGAFFSNSLIIMQRKKEFMNYTVLMDLVAPAIYFYQEIGLVVHTLFLQQKGELNA